MSGCKKKCISHTQKESIDTMALIVLLWFGGRFGRGVVRVRCPVLPQVLVAHLVIVGPGHEGGGVGRRGGEVAGAEPEYWERLVKLYTVRFSVLSSAHCWPNGCSLFSLKGTTVRTTIVLIISAC